MFEERLLDEDFRNNYAGIINLSHCISTVYEINEDDEELIPIQFTTKSTDIVKTYKYRILLFIKYFLNFLAMNSKNYKTSLPNILKKLIRISILHIKYLQQNVLNVEPKFQQSLCLLRTWFLHVIS